MQETSSVMYSAVVGPVRTPRSAGATSDKDVVIAARGKLMIEPVNTAMAPLVLRITRDNSVLNDLKRLCGVLSVSKEHSFALEKSMLAVQSMLARKWRKRVSESKVQSPKSKAS